MEANHWWLRLVTPTEKHMFWLGVGYDNETGFQALVDQASAQLDFPDDWIDRTDGPWERSLHEDPHPDLYVGATLHAEGWGEE